MKTKQEIVTKLYEVRQDDRLLLPTATILENAPLALEQLVLETWRDALRWVLSNNDKKARHAKK